MKLVIVEDEEIIRSGLRASVPWKRLGIEVVGEAEDGEQAEALIERTRPDIVVSDIRIPFMDGLTLAERVLARSPETAIVIISGHDDFGYAQKALKLGVEDYILKPIDLDQFTEVLETLCRKLEKRLREKREVEELREGAVRSERAVQTRLLNDLIAGRLPEGEAERRMPRVFSPGNWFAAIHGEIDVTGLSDPRHRGDAGRDVGQSLEQTIRGLTDRGLLLLQEPGTDFALAAAGLQKALVVGQLASAARSLRRSGEHFPGAAVTIGFGEPHQGAAGLPASCAEARRASACRYILGPNRNIEFSEVRRLTGDGTAVRLFSDSDLIWAVKLADREAIRSNLRRLLAEISKAGEQAARYVQMHAANIFLNCLDAVLDEGGSIEEVFGDPIAAYAAVISQKTAALAMEALERVLREIADYLEADRSGGRRHTVEKAKRYIRRNFGRADLSLDEVAEYVRLSASYLSSTFSRNEGRSFTDYLSHLRMERARELLLQSAYAVNEIADMVGFSSPAYFSAAFRKHAGRSPGEFRKGTGATE